MRASDNTPDPSRGLVGYATTYQGVVAAPDLQEHISLTAHYIWTRVAEPECNGFTPLSRPQSLLVV